MKDNSIEDLLKEQDFDVVIELDDEDKVISLEGITAVEKRFLNIVRKMYSQEWLEKLNICCVDKTVSEMVNKSVEDKALQETIEEYHVHGVPFEEVYGYYLSKLNDVAMREDFIDDTTCYWIKTIAEDMNGDLVPLEEVDS